MSVLKETRVKYIMYVVKLFHCLTTERVDQKHAIFCSIRPRHQTIYFLVPENLRQKHSDTFKTVHHNNDIVVVRYS